MSQVESAMKTKQGKGIMREEERPKMPSLESWHWAEHWVNEWAMQVSEEEHSRQTRQQVKQVEEGTYKGCLSPARKPMWLERGGQAKEGVIENEADR